MNAYADSSFLVAFFAPWTPQGDAVAGWLEKHAADFHWNPVLRLEVRHSLRRLQLPPAERQAAWQAYRAAEKWRARLIQRAFRFDRMLDRADELSAEDAGQSGAGTWDLFHVACAEDAEAERFLTCDRAQSVAAKAAGLSVVFLD